MLTILQYINTTSVISKWNAFSLFLSFFVLLLVLPSNFIDNKIISCFNFKSDSIFYLLYVYIYWSIIVTNNLFSMFFNTYSKYSWTSDTEYYPSANSNSSFHAQTNILELLFLYDFFLYLSMCSKCYDFQMCYLFLLVQVLLVISKAFV